MPNEEHFNIQITIQKVERPESPRTAARSTRSSVTEDEEPRGVKRVTELLNLKVTAADEKEAYSKAHRMLGAATPEWTEVVCQEVHQHRASCDDAGGNHLCGYA